METSVTLANLEEHVDKRAPSYWDVKRFLP